MAAIRIFGPFFFEDPLTDKAVTVNTKRYLEMLQQVFDEETMMEIGDHYFQQDGATCHTSILSMG